MNCCVRCFKDLEIKAIVKSTNTKGECDFCKSKNEHICNLRENEDLRDSFESLLDVYTPACNIGLDYPRERLDLLKNILNLQWNIFNLEPDDIYKFLIELLPDKYVEQPELFDGSVGISGSNKEEYLKQYSILGTFQWEDFVTEIKQKNRFHTDIIRKEILKTILQASCKQYKKGHEFYRARIWNSDSGFGINEMGAPPAKLASAGRANPEGISCLYLADSSDTTLHETRAGVYDFATVGVFSLLKDIEIVNLAAIYKISPFQEIDSSLIAINLPHLKKIGDEISKPLRRHDSLLDYLPTQYISDYIKSEGFAGIEYKSTMCRNGVNFAIFDQSLLECVRTVVYDIESLSYTYNQLD